MTERIMIYITDLSLLKITKVRNRAICFDYDNKHYLIHGSYEVGEGSWQELYERELDTNGEYYLFFLKKANGKDDVADDYIKKQRGNTIVYRNIDKEYFAYKLTKRGFCHGIMDNKVKEEEKCVAKIERQIKRYEEKIRQLRHEISGLR